MADHPESPAGVTAVSADPPHSDHAAKGPMDVSGSMFVWTLITFAVVAYVLSKFAWKPILSGLEKREEDIRKSVEHADQLQDELSKLDDTRQKVISDADSKSKEIIATARKGATEAARVIEESAKEESQILLENTRREIKAEEDKARSKLRRESADLVIDLAGKIIAENLDDEKNRKLTDKLIKQI